MRNCGILLLVVGLLCLGFVGAGTAATQGTCGENITWTLDDAGNLAITGTGAIYDYEHTGPWGTSVNSVTLSEGIQRIGNHAFSNTSLTIICIPGTVASIGDSVFDGCGQLEEIAVNGDNEYYSSADGVLFTKDGKTLLWYPAAKKDTSYMIPKEVTSIAKGVFSGCTYLEKVVIGGKDVTYGSFCFNGNRGFSSQLEKLIHEGKDIIYDSFHFKECQNLKCVILTDESKPDDTFWSFFPKKTVRYLQNSNTGNVPGYSVVVLNGGMLADAFEQHGSSLPAEDEVSRDGYTFGGWYADSELTTKYSGEIKPGSTVYAKWVPNTYTVELDGNEATSPGTSAITVTYDKNTYKISDESGRSSLVNPERSGYTFTGWYTGKIEGTMILDADGKFVENVKGYTGDDGAWCRTGDTTLYAHWERK